MNEIIMLVFTGVIAAATVVYAFYSIRLWRATRDSIKVAAASVQVAAASAQMNTAFGSWNYLLQLHNTAEEAKRRGDHKSAAVIHDLEAVMTEFTTVQFLKGINLKDPEVVAYYRKLKEVYEAQNIDPNQVPMLGDIIRQIEQ